MRSQGSKRPQESARRPPEAPRERPRCRQEPPRAVKSVPGALQEAPGALQKDPGGACGGPIWPSQERPEGLRDPLGRPEGRPGPPGALKNTKIVKKNSVKYTALPRKMKFSLGLAAFLGSKT